MVVCGICAMCVHGACACGMHVVCVGVNVGVGIGLCVYVFVVWLVKNELFGSAMSTEGQRHTHGRVRM